MTNKNIYTALSQIDPHLIADSAPQNESKKATKGLSPWIKWASLAACFCLIIAASAFTIYQIQNRSLTNEDICAFRQELIRENVTYLSAEYKTSTTVNGIASKYTGSSSSFSGSAELASPDFRFNVQGIAVVAKAVEELPSIYQTLSNYGSIHTYRYRIFKMEVLNPLKSGIGGTFFYALSEDLKGNLKQYDSLLISMSQMENNYIMLNENTKELTSFSTMFYSNEAELGNIIAFTNNVFDESLWKDSSWIYGYQFAKHYLNGGTGNDGMLVYRGSTLKDALNKLQRLREELPPNTEISAYKSYDFKTDAAKAALAYVKPFENGVFVPERYSSTLKFRRYIAGCPTNEWIAINTNTEEVTRSEHGFNDSDFNGLPDIGAYIDALDLSSLKPQHISTDGKKLLFNSAVGWYEKTQDNVYSIVRIAWRYSKTDDCYEQYYDETFILLDGSGAKIISREKLKELIGENDNISEHDYDLGIVMPN